MIRLLQTLCFLVLYLMTASFSQVKGAIHAPMNANAPVHDPCIIREGDYYYLFATGDGVPIRRSKDLIQWEISGRVFAQNVPEWAKKAIPQSRNLWAPDISLYNGKFRLTYSISSFGSNRSIIASASNKTLDPAGKDYHWDDDGIVFESQKTDNYNAIDSNLLLLDKKRGAMTFGSFWSGIKLIYIDLKTGKPFPNSVPISLAQRPTPDALEAPFLIKRGKFFYLFVSFDFCCRGVNSTYNIRVGRSNKVEGTYLDKEGKPMGQGGGTVLVQSEGNFIGPGHCAVLQEKSGDKLVHHYYDGTRNGFPTVQVRPLVWTKEGWPEAGKPLGEN